MNEAAKGSASHTNRIRFRRYRPSRRLASFVRNFWTARSCDAGGAAKQQRILPDGCIDIVFVRGSPTADYQGCVVGTMTRPAFENLAGHVDYLGIRFAPGGFRHFFEMPPSELTDRIVPFENLSIAPVAVRRLAETDSIETRLEILETDLGRRSRPVAQDPVVDRVLNAISACAGNVTMVELARQVDWSPRHLRRRFTACVGVGPKTFCQITRFKKAIRILRRSARPDSLKAALEAGYYDQAHFIHEFNRFYGACPSIVSDDPRL
ncbi:MAG: AraC family transcriptional regulator [Sedimentisphaerales bacterium]|nr:AraC family transcriptional regulator [Sedimentisphaerales bacterium]